MPHDPELAPIRRRAAGLTKYAVEYRYPGLRATTRQMRSAVEVAERVPGEMRTRLGLRP